MEKPQGAVQWQLKQVAMRGLVLLALYESGGAVTDDTGHVAARLRDWCGIPDTANNAKYISTVLQRLADEGTIRRKVDDARKRTYSVELLVLLNAETVANLRADKVSNAAQFASKSEGKTEDEEPTPEMDALIRECTLAWNAIVRAAESPVRREGEFVALSVSAVLKTVGIYGVAAKRTRYYLRVMGYIKSSRRVEGESYLYWWRINIGSLDCDKLRELATGHRSFERWEAMQGGAAAAGPVTVTQVETADLVALDKSDSEPLTSPASRTRLEAVIKLAERLERELGESHRENRALQEQLRTQRSDHEKEVAGYEAELTEMRERLGIAQRAADLLARIGSGNTSAS